MADKQLPIHQRLVNHLMQEMGQEAVDKHLQYVDSVTQNVQRYKSKYGQDRSRWPKDVLNQMYRENGQIEDMLIPKHLREANDRLSELESVQADYPGIEQLLRKENPDLVARMERGQVQRIEEPRAPTPQPQAPTPEPSKTKEPPRPAMVAPAQKPGEVKQPKMVVTAGPSALRQRERQPSAFEKAVASQRDKWEKEGLFTPPPMQDIAKQRLLQLHDKEEEEVPVSLPEAVNPTAR